MAIPSFCAAEPNGFFIWPLGSGSAECKELRYGLLWDEEKAMSTFVGFRAQNPRILRHGPSWVWLGRIQGIAAWPALG